jgi:hypothetical protein
MRSFATCRPLLIGAIAACAAAAGFAGPAQGRPGFEIAMPKKLQGASEVSEFASREEAKAFLAHALPIATAGNPRYRSADAGVLTAWITKTIRFDSATDSNGILVSMSEDVLEFRNGIRGAAGSHDTQFLIGDVAVSERRDSGDFTENGEAAVGVQFRCNSGKCIRASYGGAPSLTDWTDISIQDDALRRKILAAFRALQDRP